MPDARFLVALYRNPRFSPAQHRSNDVLILDATVDALEARGWRIERADERAVEDGRVPPSGVYANMCQGPKASVALRDAVNGALVVNGPNAVLGCHRHRLAQTMRCTGLAFPETLVRDVDDQGPLPGALAAADRVWLKRGDVHAEGPEDVVATTPDRVVAAQREFARRGIRAVAVQAHVAGPVIKFYAVGSTFFHWYLAEPGRNGHPPVDEPALRALAAAAAQAVGLGVYGGDAVMTPDGPVLIDLNDWPSFAPVRAAAAEAIASYIDTHPRNGRHS